MKYSKFSHKFHIIYNLVKQRRHHIKVHIGSKFVHFQQCNLRLKISAFSLSLSLSSLCPSVLPSLPCILPSFSSITFRPLQFSVPQSMFSRLSSKIDAEYHLPTPPAICIQMPYLFHQGLEEGGKEIMDTWLLSTCNHCTHLSYCFICIWSNQKNWILAFVLPLTGC